MQYVVSTKEQLQRLEDKIADLAKEYEINASGNLFASVDGIVICIYPAKNSEIKDVVPLHKESKGIFISAGQDEARIKLNNTEYYITYKTKPSWL